MSASPSPSASTRACVLPDGTTQGTNEFGGLGYTGPCPPPSVVRKYTQPGRIARWTARIGLGEQVVTTKTLRRRFFSLAGRITRSARRLTLHLRVYALDAKLDLGPAANKDDLTAAMDGHVVGYGETGRKRLTTPSPRLSARSTGSSTTFLQT